MHQFIHHNNIIEKIAKGASMEEVILLSMQEHAPLDYKWMFGKRTVQENLDYIEYMSWAHERQLKDLLKQRKKLITAKYVRSQIRKKHEQELKQHHHNIRQDNRAHKQTEIMIAELKRWNAPNASTDFKNNTILFLQNSIKHRYPLINPKKRKFHEWKRVHLSALDAQIEMVKKGILKYKSDAYKAKEALLDLQKSLKPKTKKSTQKNHL